MGFLIFLTLLVVGYLFGRMAEKRHYRSINERENQYRSITLMPLRIPPPELLKHDSQLVSGSVVISVDYFKTVAAGLRNLIGGRVGAYESLIDRARREATLRM
ncbi:MAG: heavy metal-binding domain-containing protein, partial [Oleibacter sp.]|nr:heavy metal-binding domain-containing protein [Thalassolituus sp.]